MLTSLGTWTTTWSCSVSTTRSWIWPWTCGRYSTRSLPRTFWKSEKLLFFSIIFVSHPSLRVPHPYLRHPLIFPTISNLPHDLLKLSLFCSYLPPVPSHWHQNNMKKLIAVLFVQLPLSLLGTADQKWIIGGGGFLFSISCSYFLLRESNWNTWVQDGGQTKHYVHLVLALAFSLLTLATAVLY